MVATRINLKLFHQKKKQPVIVRPCKMITSLNVEWWWTIYDNTPAECSYTHTILPYTVYDIHNEYGSFFSREKCACFTMYLHSKLGFLKNYIYKRKKNLLSFAKSGVSSILMDLKWLQKINNATTLIAIRIF